MTIFVLIGIDILINKKSMIFLVWVIQNEKTIPSISELFSRLHLEETNLKLLQGTTQEEVLVMRIRNIIRGRFSNTGRGTYQNFQRRNGIRASYTSSDLCNWCGESGHFAKVCTAPVPLPSNFQKSYTPFSGRSNEGNLVYDTLGEDLSFSDESIEAALAARAVDTNQNHEWVLDSSASRHFANNPDMFTNLEQDRSHSIVTSASGHDHVIQVRGSVEIPMPNGEIQTIKDVRYVSGLNENLLSIGQITDSGNLVLFTKSMCLVLTLKKPWKTVAVGSRDPKTGLYKFSSFANSLEAHNIEAPLFTGEISSETHSVITNAMSSQTAGEENNRDTARLWHRRLGHLNYDTLAHMSKQSDEMPTLPPVKEICETC